MSRSSGLIADQRGTSKDGESRSDIVTCSIEKDKLAYCRRTFCALSGTSKSTAFRELFYSRNALFLINFVKYERLEFKWKKKKKRKRRHQSRTKAEAYGSWFPATMNTLSNLESCISSHWNSRSSRVRPISPNRARLGGTDRNFIYLSVLVARFRDGGHW